MRESPPDPKPLSAEVYRWIETEPGGWSNYERLLRPNGTVVTVITEPEDRISYRDLAPITAELNAQAETIRELTAALGEIVRAPDYELRGIARAALAAADGGSDA